METQIREAVADDRDAMLSLAPRLQEGVAAWRDPTAVGRAVRDWVADSFAERGQPDHVAFVAERDGELVGFVCVSERATSPARSTPTSGSWSSRSEPRAPVSGGRW